MMELSSLESRRDASSMMLTKVAFPFYLSALRFLTKLDPQIVVIDNCRQYKQVQVR